MSSSIHKVGQLLGFTESFDMFGCPITLKFNQRDTHKTKLGAIMTILIVVIFTLQVFNIIIDLFSYNRMSIIYQEEMVDVPSRFELLPSQFSFAFSILDSKLNYLMDSSLYNVEAVYLITEKMFNITTSKYQFVTKDITFQPVPCTQDHFQIEGAQSYFKGLQYQSLYCLPIDSKFALEGQFGANTYQRLRIRIKQCQGETCQAPEAIFQKLSNCQFQIHYVNYALRITNRTNPFQPYGQNQFWKFSNNTLKNINIYFRNAFIDSYEGILDSSKSTRYNSLMYSFDREQSMQQFDNTILEAYVNLEKNKESHYFRTYKTLNQGLSELGGLFNFILCIGTIICYPVSCLFFRQNLLNSIFSFQQLLSPIKPESIKNEKDISKSRASLLAAQMFKKYNQELIIQNLNSPKLEDSTKNIFQSEVIKSSQNKTVNENHQLEVCQNYPQIQMKQEISKQALQESLKPRKSFLGTLINKINNSIYRKENEQDSQSQLNKSQNQATLQAKKKGWFFRRQQPREKEQQEMFQKKIQSSFINKLFNYKNQRQISLFELVISIISNLMSYLPFWKMSPKSKMIQYSLDKLDLHLDIYYIIDKLLELEKLKKLLLNEEQIKLFDLIPKPVLHKDLFKSQQTADNLPELNNHIFYSCQKTHTQKVKDAQDAFNVLFSNSTEKDSYKNKKLVKLLDPQILLYLENNLFKLDGVTQLNVSDSNYNSGLAISLKPQYLIGKQEQKSKHEEKLEDFLSNCLIPDENIDQDFQMITRKLDSINMQIKNQQNSLNQTIS